MWNNLTAIFLTNYKCKMQISCQSKNKNKWEDYPTNGHKFNKASFYLQFVSEILFDQVARKVITILNQLGFDCRQRQELSDYTFFRNWPTSCGCCQLECLSIRIASNSLWLKSMWTEIEGDKREKLETRTNPNIVWLFCAHILAML